MTTACTSQPPAAGGVYLCQVGENVSCGACCGLYNVPECTRDHLEGMLAHRTAVFEKTPRNIRGIERFARTVADVDPASRPYPAFHHCPFLGLIGRKRSRVGCLLHPLSDGNAGVDYRGLSHYGGMACRIYFCPTHRLVPGAFLETALCCRHWRPLSNPRTNCTGRKASLTRCMIRQCRH